MPCKDLQAQLPLYAGRELDVVQSAALGRHLESCPTCASTAKAYAADVRTLNHYGRELVSQAPAPDLMARLRPMLGRPQPPAAPTLRAAARRKGGAFL
ncbi:MAG TPA: zf-HC2 domain-containing protein [Planctomycetota bacterium]|nr:zf-HC2 domain-containing protein [Planctomycetota bacterium]